MRWLCRLGLHSWNYDIPETSEDAVTESGIFFRVIWWRGCSRCGKRQVETKSRWYLAR